MCGPSDSRVPRRRCRFDVAPRYVPRSEEINEDGDYEGRDTNRDRDRDFQDLDRHGITETHEHDITRPRRADTRYRTLRYLPKWVNWGGRETRQWPGRSLSSKGGSLHRTIWGAGGGHEPLQPCIANRKGKRLIFAKIKCKKQLSTETVLSVFGDDPPVAHSPADINLLFARDDVIRPPPAATCTTFSFSKLPRGERSRAGRRA